MTLLVALSVVSVAASLGAGYAPAADSPPGTALAQTEPAADLAPRGRWTPTTSTGEIILDASSYFTVFQGERDVTAWRRASDDEDVTGSVLSGEGGAAEGDVLSLDGSIPSSQTTGRYSGDGLSARVVEPRISTMDLVNRNGVELDDDPTIIPNQRLLLVVRWNYVRAEDVQVDLLEDSLAIEREAFSTTPSAAQAERLPENFSNDFLAREVQGSGSTGFSTAFWLFDFGDLEEGNYTLRVEGVDDLTFGDATRTSTVQVGTSGSPTPTTTTDGGTATPRTETPSPDAPATTADGGPATQTPTETATPTGTPTATPTETAATTTEASTPGFGVSVGLAALAAFIAVLGRRRP